MKKRINLSLIYDNVKEFKKEGFNLSNFVDDKIKERLETLKGNSNEEIIKTYNKLIETTEKKPFCKFCNEIHKAEDIYQVIYSEEILKQMTENPLFDTGFVFVCKDCLNKKSYADLFNIDKIEDKDFKEELKKISYSEFLYKLEQEQKKQRKTSKERDEIYIKFSKMTNFLKLLAKETHTQKSNAL